MFKESESRGKEASGIAIRTDAISIYKQPTSASAMLRTRSYKNFLNKALKPLCNQEGLIVKPITLIGHSRLVTNGSNGIQNNNQPVVYEGAVAVHNGIVVNADTIWAAHSDLKRHTDLDTEALVALLGKNHQQSSDIVEAIKNTYKEIKGSISLAALFDNLPYLLLTTNTGSLYMHEEKELQLLCFASEEHMLRKILRSQAAREFSKETNFAHAQPEKIAPLTCALINLETFSYEKYSCTADNTDRKQFVSKLACRMAINDMSRYESDRRQALRRCTKCILPETMPFIRFDEQGICNYCINYKPSLIAGEARLLTDVERYIRENKNPNANCLVAFSGGRDSSYALYYIKEKLGLNPIAYTFDWGMVTDLARRNQARICGQLGIEHIVISADIRKKRDNIRKNIEAWLKKPSLGMIPLFMAGDKQYMHYPFKIMENLGLNLLFFCGNRLEKTGFKTGFCGVEDVSNWYFDFSLAKKLQILTYYSKQYLTNLSYINSSLLDTCAGVYSSFFRKTNYLQFFEYLPWDEAEINQTLKREFDWELAGDTTSSWRIGDGTAAFYNYIYYTVAGFTENDTFRSNQIREGTISREEALKSVLSENQPRYQTIREYANTIGFDYDRALQVINAIPKLYVKKQKPMEILCS